APSADRSDPAACSALLCFAEGELPCHSNPRAYINLMYPALLLFANRYVYVVQDTAMHLRLSPTATSSSSSFSNSTLATVHILHMHDHMHDHMHGLLDLV